jgi:hypothetical protein
VYESSAKKNERYNRSLEARDINGPKRPLYYSEMALPPFQDPNMFAGVKKAQQGILSHEGRFIKPSKNKSSAFSHLDLSQENYNNILHLDKHTRRVVPNDKPA